MWIQLDTLSILAPESEKKYFKYKAVRFLVREITRVGLGNAITFKFHNLKLA